MADALEEGIYSREILEWVWQIRPSPCSSLGVHVVNNYKNSIDLNINSNKNVLHIPKFFESISLRLV